MITLRVVFEALVNKSPDWAKYIITDAVVDSRRAIPGSLFVAIPGENADGHDFVGDAFLRGACFALVQEDRFSEYPVLDLRSGFTPSLEQKKETPFCILVEDTVQALQTVAKYWRNQLDIRVIGITGSVGKTTTKELAASVLKQRYRTLKNSGNLNNEIGLPLTLWQMSQGHARAILEMGFYVPGEIKFLCDLAKPSVGVVTNIGTVHAERAGSQETIAQGKAELIQSLPPAPDGVAILNYDDPLVRKMAEDTQARVFFYGLDPEADLWADSIEGLGLEGIRFRLHYRGETIYLRVPLLGRHSVHTALRATAIGLIEGLTWHEIVNGLRSGHMQLRLVAVRAQSGAFLLDDTYNASPQSMMAALNLLEEMDGRKIAVLGDMLELGRYERQGHEKVGIRAASVADVLITIGKLGKIMAEAAAWTGLPKERIITLEDNEAAIEFLREYLHKEDVVLIKGSRGMGMDRIVATLEERS
ncbi:MAG: UDP-N-acetylmuramoyl-tripeptide--D-alanyl-D-alanine ligase [Chloroflexota bacterium]|nr:UDP-N-acetylmuramoyl-tripeptide--D-alanyl-D-alanine ligase [Chloroflexota bacterium]